MLHRAEYWGLFILGLVLVIGGIIISFTNSEGPEWVGKSIAIIVGALVALAGGTELFRHPQ